MDLNKAKRFLDKINREFGRMTKNPEDIASIDRDILLDYTRDFYDALLAEEKTRVQVAKAPAPVPTPKPVAKAPRTIRVSGPQQTAPKAAAPKAPTPVPVKKAAPKPVLVAPKPVPVVPPPVPKPTPVAVPKPTPPTPRVVPTQLRTTPEVAALFEFAAARELSEKLIQPVKDIWKAIGLNDRLLYTKELFGGSQEEMKKTVENLNTLGSFDAAKTYLIQTAATSNDWGNERRAEFARDFVKTVRRRFL